jgi:small subunit ribosomal protein S6
MNKYEAMFIVKSDLPEAERKNLFSHINDVITKNNGNVQESSVWADKKKLYFSIKKQREGLYYLVSFTVSPLAIKEISHSYNLNENILRVLFTKLQ